MCRVAYFQFPIQVCFSSMLVGQAAQRRIGLRNIRHRKLPKLWVGTFLVRGVHPEAGFGIDSNGKMETRHPVEGYFGSEFRAICNHCGVIAA